jgi:hypothetical protein
MCYALHCYNEQIKGYEIGRTCDTHGSSGKDALSIGRTYERKITVGRCRRSGRLILNGHELRCAMFN